MIFAKNKIPKASPDLVTIFSALGDKTRYQILKTLNSRKDICVSELAAVVGISNAGVSQQLKVLEQAGLVKRNRMGQRICYSVETNSEINRKVYKLIS